MSRSFSLSGSGELAYHLDGAVAKLSAERFEGGDEVKGEGVGLPPEAYQEANSDSPQHRCLPDHLINRRPVPVKAADPVRRGQGWCGDVCLLEAIFHLVYLVTVVPL